MEPGSANPGQLVDTSKRFARRLLAIGENRLELLKVEVQDERERLLRAIPGHFNNRKQTNIKTGTIMNRTSVRTGKALRVFGTILLLGAMPLLLGVTGCATGNRYEQSTGERIDDHGTSSRVKSMLSDDPQYKFDGVNVETFKGTVQLSGFVNSADQKNRAADLAKEVPGVKEIINNITVKETVK